MTKILIYIYCVVMLAGAAVAIIAFVTGEREPEGIPGLTIVATPPQDGPERPGVFPDPSENWVKLPESPNLAEGKRATSGEFTEVYDPVNVTDGDLTSYWESRGVPAELIIDLADIYTIQTVAVRLNPAPIWEARTQSFEVLISGDGDGFTTVSPDTRHEFTPDTGNIVRIDFDPAAARYVKLTFTMNSSGRSNGGQVSEIEIFE